MVAFERTPTIVGRAVRLRPVTAEDAASMFADLQDEEAVRLTGTHSSFTLEEIERWTASRAQQADRWDLAVTDRATGAWLGEVVVSGWDPHDRSCGFRIALSPGARDRGIGTEVTRLVVDELFTRVTDPSVNRVELEVFAFNPRAAAVYERVGFVVEGVRREALWWDGEPVDATMMALLRRDWEADAAAR